MWWVGAVLRFLFDWGLLLWLLFGFLWLDFFGFVVYNCCGCCM